MARTLEQIDADIARFQAALDESDLGTRVAGMKHGERDIQFANGGAPTSRLNRRLLELKHERSLLTGDRSPASPIVPGIPL
ncbi:hypothetical protein [Maricaulis sp.]|uniref:hypothetical protein n=1 Tax=Maricaulis sp. TaxID=1486257 RepID=UPI003A913D73